MPTHPVAQTNHRVLAAVIDGVIAGAIGFVLSMLLSWIWGFLGIIGVLASAGFMLVRDTLLDGRSPGKKAFDLKIVDYESGKPITRDQALRRNAVFAAANATTAVQFLPWIGGLLLMITVPVGGIAGIYELWLWYKSEEWRRWGDDLAGTIVIGPQSEVAAEEQE